ncbi:MAG: hypothetical protein Q8L39_01890 [Burkholderiales bacterium]|nr:hypothetical protein [Burkholderiales bacterium]
MLNFIGFAFIVQLLLAIAFAMFRDMFTRHSLEVGRVLRLPTRSELLARTMMAKVLHWTAVDYRRRARAAPAQRLQPFGDAHPTDPTHLAVFVRGTFGAPGYDKRWNQVEATLKAVHPRTAFFCFYWPGHNGERARRADGAALAEALAALSARHRGRPILAVGHSHGGTVIEHASRTLSCEVPLVPILLAAPTLQYDEKLADRSHAHLTALLYASAVFIPALLLHLMGWALWLLRQPALQQWNLAWFEPLGIAAVVAVFALRPAARRARETLGAAPPAPRHAVRHIWCRGDEVFDLFTRADAVRVASDTLREAWHERLERLRAEPWVRVILFELVACVLCWILMDASVRELARSDPAMLHPLVREPGLMRDMSVILAAMFLKLLVYGRPRVYRALASMTSLVLFAMRAGLAQLCRVTLAGLSFTEGILVEVLPRLPVSDGWHEVEVEPSVKSSRAMAVHSATLGDKAVMQALAKMASAVASD